MSDLYQQSLELHENNKGKLSVESKVALLNWKDLSLAYTPGVAEPCRKIFENHENLYRYTIKANTIAVITDGSAVLGLGNIGAEAGLPVMEGKCLLFKKFAGINAFPLCIKTQNPDEFVEVVKNIAPVFGGINLEDIAAPHCFIIEERLKKELNIPVFHDDQHGTAVVILAAMINAAKLTGYEKEKMKIVISGAGAAGMASAKLLLGYGYRNIIVCDRQGALESSRNDLEKNPYKKELAQLTNPLQEKGTLHEVIQGAHVFIGVSVPGILNGKTIKTMAKNPVIFAMANPVPEIMPDEAKAAGAFIVGTGRSDFPNQVNNVLAFPGIFRGVMNLRATHVTESMKIAAAESLARFVALPSPEKIIPGVFEPGVAETVAESIMQCANSVSCNALHQTPVSSI